MNYQSTRNNQETVTSAEAIVKGLAHDGGLYVPKEIPSVSLDEISNLANLSYQERAKVILGKFLTDFSNEELVHCIDSAYHTGHFETEEIAPVRMLSEKEYVLELWHGPTCAFKDMALQILPHFLTTSLKKTGETKEIVILVATSGDTGKAALEGFKDVPGTRIIVYYPEEGVSRIQKLQMITQSGENVGVCAVKGNFDDAQNGVKAIFTDAPYQKTLEENGFLFSSANSINWGRLVPQIVYYFSGYATLLKNQKISVGDKINIVVPTGNFGNILAAYYAKKMGLPVNKLICASNQNNVLTDFIKTGVYDKNRPFYTSISPSMDILISSNLERLLFDITGGDTAMVSKWMDDLKQNGKYELTDSLKETVKELFWGGFCNDEATKETIEKTFEACHYTMDTHTAVAKNVYDQYQAETGDQTVTLIASTASPFKFGQSVLSAVAPESAASLSDEFELLDSLSKISELSIPKSLAELKTKSPRFTESVEPADMKAFINQTLQLK